MKRIIIGITGASGSIYAKKLIEELAKLGYEIHLVVTDNGKKVFKFELDLDLDVFINNLHCGKLVMHDNDDMFSCIASGSFKTSGMVILPATMSSVAKIANGIADTLLCRAADVALKEKLNLIICPRESPFNSIHLKNMLTLSKTSAIILPLLPAFYTKPKSIDDIVTNSVGRILRFFDCDLREYYEWGVTQNS